jgi:kynurenine 3-monooxygenase
MGNYREMASDVKKPLYLLRKWVEEQLYLYVPSAGWATQYSRVTFSNLRYSEVIQASQRQAKILHGMVGLALASVAGAAFWFARSGGAQQAKMGILRSICVIAQKLQKLTEG